MDAKLVMCKERKTDTDDERFTKNSFEHTNTHSQDESRFFGMLSNDNDNDNG